MRLKKGKARILLVGKKGAKGANVFFSYGVCCHLELLEGVRERDVIFLGVIRRGGVVAAVVLADARPFMRQASC